MTDSLADAFAEQQAAPVDPPEGASLYDPAAQERLLLAALRFRQTAITLEYLAKATDPRLALSYLTGAYRFLEEGRRFLHEACGGESG